MESEFKLNKIGIRFTDNDFMMTVVSFLLMFCERFAFGNGRNGFKDEGEVKSVISELFNRSAAGFYWTCQNQLEYDVGWDASEYLQIETDRVFVNKGVDEYLAACPDNWDNSEFHYYDFHLKKIFTI